VKTDRYAAFGATESSTGASANNRLANTKERSATLGLDNHGFRYYDPEIGRYISRDLIGYMDGPNVYIYTHNNPINRIDPLGLDDDEVKKKVRDRTDRYKDDANTMRGKFRDNAKAHRQFDSSQARDEGPEAVEKLKKGGTYTDEWDSSLHANGTPRQVERDLQTEFDKMTREYVNDVSSYGAEAAAGGELKKALTDWKNAVDSVAKFQYDGLSPEGGDDPNRAFAFYNSGGSLHGQVTIRSKALDAGSLQIFAALFHEGEHARYGKVSYSGPLAGKGTAEHAAIYLRQREVLLTIYGTSNSATDGQVKNFVFGYANQADSGITDMWPSQINFGERFGGMYGSSSVPPLSALDAK